MLDKLKEVEKRYLEVTKSLSDPTVLANRELFRKLSREHSELEPVVECYRSWRKSSEELAASNDLLRETDDPEMRSMAHEDVSKLKAVTEKLEQELTLSLMPKDPNDHKNVILEIRAGAGGDEAALFGQDLMTMYLRYAESRRWNVELMSSSESSVGGYKEVIVRIEGNGAFSALKYERGVHRVQRVPQTETQGRIHTSTVTVAVLPEAEEVEIVVPDKDLRIDVYRSSGPGGQSVNTTDSAVRITHLPSGMVVTCQDEKSQHKNKAKALTVLRSRLLDMRQQEADDARRDDRRSQIGTGDRSERIRTYNFPQGRVTDHRIGLTLYQIETVLSGDLRLLIEPLATHYRAEALKTSQPQVI